jgi:hypothetical protein
VPVHLISVRSSNPIFQVERHGLIEYFRKAALASSRRSGSEIGVSGKRGVVDKNGVVGKYGILSKNDPLERNDVRQNAATPRAADPPTR